jgi:hypothetical protein
MLQPRDYRLPAFAQNPLVRQTLPTGNGFGGSSLLEFRPERDLIFPIVSSSATFVDLPPSICIQQSSPLIVEVSKIVLLALWFWCSIGADFCFNSISSIVGSCARDV